MREKVKKILTISTIVFLLIFSLRNLGGHFQIGYSWDWLAVMVLLLIQAWLKREALIATLTHPLQKLDVKKRKTFVCLGLLNVFASLFIPLVYAIFSGGGPLVYEEKNISNFKTHQTIKVYQETKLQQEFTASTNNLGNIILELQVLEPNKVYLKENEKPDGTIVPLTLEFKIKEVGATSWLAINQYHFDRKLDRQGYPIGFPVIEDSRGKNYLFELTLIEQEEESDLEVLIRVDSDKNINFTKKYILEKNRIINQKINFFILIANKLVQFIINQEFIFIFSFHLISSSYLLLSYLRHGNRNRQIGLLLALVSSLILIKLLNLDSSIMGSSDFSTFYFAATFATLSVLALLTKTPKNQEGESLLDTKKSLHLFGIFFIIVLFTLIKYPHFNTSFTGVHTMKYNSHVEPAKYMLENNNVFWWQKKYLANPVNNPEGIFKSIGTLPLNEWGLFLFFKTFPNNSIEYNTRLFTHFVGIIFLISIYAFFNMWLSKEKSLIAVLLIAMHPIIILNTFLTVEDSWLLVFTFISLFFTIKHVQKKSYTYLLWSGVFLGLGLISKISIALWLAPATTVILLFNSRSIEKFFYTLAIFFSGGAIIYFVFNASLTSMPTDGILSVLKFIIFLLIVPLIHLFLKKVDNGLLDNKAKLFLKNKYLLLICSVTFATILILFFIRKNFLSVFQEFLTDPDLLFNWQMYKFMFNEQFKEYATHSFFYMSLFSVIVTPFLLNKKSKIVLTALFFSAFTYWILASKSIFFHNYYTHLFMIAGAVSIAIFLSSMKKRLEKPFGEILTIALIIILLSQMIPASKETMSKEFEDMQSFEELANFLIQNTSENQIYIDDSYLLSLTIKTGRPRIEPSALDSKEVRKIVQEKGFSAAMKKYNISYLITRNPEIKYEEFVNVFSTEGLLPTSYRRRDRIFSTIYEDFNYFQDLEKRREIIEKNNIQDKFYIEKKIGPYTIIGFND